MNVENPDRVLTQTQIDSIGILHNIFLSEALSQFQCDLNDTDEEMMNEMYNIFLSIESSGLDLSLTEKECLFVKRSDKNYLSDLSDKLSETAMNILVDATNYVENDTNYSYQDLQNQIYEYKGMAHASLVGEDLYAVLIFFSVLENSAYYWMPTYKDGSGEGTQTLATVNSNRKVKNKELTKWEKCLLADAAGATTAFLEIGFCLIATPVTLKALVVVVGVQSAFSTAWSLVI